jgi:hypothetical protein
MKRLTICFIHFFVFLCGTSSLYSQSSNNLRKELCYYCSGHKLIREQVTCSNCRNWNAEYRRKVPCRVCKDSRSVIGPIIKCTRCGGKGYRLVDNISARLKYIKDAVPDCCGNQGVEYWKNFTFVIVGQNQIYFESSSKQTKYEFFDDGTFYFTSGGQTYLGDWEKAESYNAVRMNIYKGNEKFYMFINLGEPSEGFTRSN